MGIIALYPLVTQVQNQNFIDNKRPGKYSCCQCAFHNHSEWVIQVIVKERAAKFWYHLSILNHKSHVLSHYWSVTGKVTKASEKKFRFTLEKFMYQAMYVLASNIFCMFISQLFQYYVSLISPLKIYAWNHLSIQAFNRSKYIIWREGQADVEAVEDAVICSWAHHSQNLF